MKLHIGCGTIYLRGWININPYDEHTYLAKDRPDLVRRYETDESEYYGRHEDKTINSLRPGPLCQEQVCDVYGEFSTLPYGANTVDEILARHCFEHLSVIEARTALDRMFCILKVGGFLRLAVPDHEKTMDDYRETGDHFYKRHLLGPRNSDRGYHVMSYDRDRLKALVEKHGFRCQHEEPNINFYPAFCLRFAKTMFAS